MPVVTWDSVNKGSGVTLSNGNLTATIPNYNNTVRATISRNSGKWYWEIKCDSISYAMIGIVNSSAGVDRTFDSSNAIYYYSATGNKYKGTNTVYGSSYTTGDIISVLLDLDNGTIEFWKNGVSQGIAFTNVKSLGDVYPAVTSGSNSVGGTVTANFGASPFVYNIPKGWYSYDGSQYGAINKILILSSDGEVESLSGGNEYEFSPSNMTSNTSPSPYNVTTSSVYSTYQGWQSFDGVEPLVNTANGWIANGTTGTITLDLGVGNEQVLTRYEFYPYYPDPTRSPKDWKIQGSNDNVTWIDIDTQVGITGWTAGVKKSFNITSGVKDKFRYFRVNVTANNGGTYLAIGEINFFSLTPKYIKSIPSQTEQDFINHGMDSLSSIDPKSNFTKKQYIQSQSSVLGSGKTFTQPIDLTRYKVNKISFQ
jgi:hypothetical protein